jgi:hypothetical protein
MKRGGEFYGMASGRQDEDFLAVAVIDEEACALAGSVDRDRLGDAGLDRGQAERQAGDRAVGARERSLHNGADDDKKGKGLFAHVGTSQRRCFLSPRTTNLSQKYCTDDLLPRSYVRN